MAYARPRSVNAELDQGMIDGKYRQVNPDRGGVVENGTYDSRRDLSDTWHGIHESSMKVTPDGRHVHTPYTVGTPCADPVGF